MSRCVLVILTSPVEGREEEFDAWYDAHLDHMLELEDCVSAQRLRHAPYDDSTPPYRHLAIYEFETEDPKATADRVHARMGTEAMPRNPAAETTVGWYFTPIEEQRTAPATGSA